MAETAAGFWSYAREDDEDDGGRIRALAGQLRAEYSVITGLKLELFLDRDSIEWGDAWRERIDQAIAGTTFFIPVLTPRYFRSQECRRELLKFTGEARRLDLDELLLSVYYVDVPGLEDDPADEAMALVKDRHWEDLRDARLEDPTSATYRRTVHRLAQRLAGIAERVTHRPIPALGEAPRAPSASNEVEEPPGLIELRAQAEEALPRLSETMGELRQEVERLGALADAARAEVDASDARGGGFAGRLAATTRLAKSLEAPAERISTLGHTFARDMVAVHPGLLTLFEEIEEGVEDVAAARELLQAIQALRQPSAEAMDHLRTLTRELDSASRLSRSLRPPLRKVQAGLQGVVDGQNLIDEWDRRARVAERSLDDMAVEDEGADPSAEDPTSDDGPK